ncbi:Hypothetical protein AA314_00546 [Archangium gephyra]|uniref:Uncharacterized protein n=1 Tax=Archangium gephyra TaxID=48 RepID=A0AAC8TAG7_9BACT|nr:Hypothetical protein AA314_00546 [Archangium gephyra]
MTGSQSSHVGVSAPAEAGSGSLERHRLGRAPAWPDSSQFEWE